ncbi:hypothetical protein [Owenweeksia hongkongensis]|uniref:hypothetical protein n=1 Tax=Owenweeksia hongkongensis TaxID=253245 RepID=UPI003A9044E1
MKSIKRASMMLAILSFMLAAPSLSAQNSSGEKELKEGKIWSVEYIRTKPGMADDYKKYLAKNYMQVMNKAKEEGLIADFILLEGMPSNEDDWDIMILIAVNKYGDMDGMDEKFDKIVAQVFDPKDEGRQKELKSRFEMRKFMGGKMARQLELK